MGNCIYKEKCLIFKLFRQESARNIFVVRYCDGDYGKCERKILRDKGEPVPDKLLPNGQYLP